MPSFPKPLSYVRAFYFGARALFLRCSFSLFLQKYRKSTPQVPRRVCHILPRSFSSPLALSLSSSIALYILSPKPPRSCVSARALSLSRARSFFLHRYRKAMQQGPHTVSHVVDPFDVDTLLVPLTHLTLSYSPSLSISRPCSLTLVRARTSALAHECTLSLARARALVLIKYRKATQLVPCRSSHKHEVTCGLVISHVTHMNELCHTYE